MKKQTQNKQDGYGNKISIKNMDEINNYFDISLNKDMWLNGDKIQIMNKEGCVINTIIVKDKRLL